LNAVISKEFRELMNSALAKTNLWVNLFYVGLILLTEYFVLAARAVEWKLPWVILLCLALSAFAYWRARNSAEEWGEWVKAAFDTFLPELCKKLGYARPPTWQQEQELWLKFSQAIVFHDDRLMEQLERFRDHTPPKSSSSS
jgi:hypothetical protein